VQLVFTTEVRWFLRAREGAVDVLESAFDGVAPEPVREDRYVPTAREDLGVKIRDAKGKRAVFETKDRMATATPTRFTAAIAGRVERWRKISVAVARTEATLDGALVDVRKLRRARRFALAEGRVVEVPRDPPISPCCVVEWTTVEVDLPSAPSTIWTLGFEATGPDDTQLPCLVAVAHELFGSLGDLQLPLAASFGYARLLADVQY
jgi:hypothetical protein